MIDIVQFDYFRDHFEAVQASQPCSDVLCEFLDSQGLFHLGFLFGSEVEIQKVPRKTPLQRDEVRSGQLLEFTKFELH